MLLGSQGSPSAHHSKGPEMNGWTCCFALDKLRKPCGGSADSLSAAVRRGADVRIYTRFDWRDHMGLGHADQGEVEESIDLRVAYLLENQWVAALTATRYPADAGMGFGPNPSLSFFMYNQDGS